MQAMAHDRAGRHETPAPQADHPTLAALAERMATIQRHLAEIEHALRDIGVPTAPPALRLLPPGRGATGAAPLSRREVEVLRLLAGGGNNRAIARTLSLSPRTIERHIANIYLKIDAHNKAEATAYALRQGLL